MVILKKNEFKKKRVFISRYLTIFFLFLSTCFLVSCRHETRRQEGSDENQLLTDFFKQILIYDSGIYTLWGSKPITFIDMSEISQEEINKWLADMSEEEKKNNILHEDLNLKEGWNKWKQVSCQFPMKKYMLFESNLFGSSDDPVIVFVNILKTATVIEDNYELFKRKMGFDFHPLEVTLEIKNNTSSFWRAVFNNHSDLMGIILGFGKENSTIFHWKNFDHPQSCDLFCENLSYRGSNERAGYIAPTIEDLELPGFIYFDVDNEVKEKYEREREKIQKIYKNKDFLKVTLDKLTES